MSAPWFRTPSAYTAMYQRLQGVECIRDYHNSKTDIENKIAKLNKTNPKHFCNNCRQIKEIIISKDEEFKRCSANRSKQLKLIDVDGDIHRFMDECITLQECLSKRSARNKQVTLKSTNTGLCEKNGPCKNEKARTGGVGSKEQQRLGTETSKMGSSRTQKPQPTRAEQAEEKLSNEQFKVSQTPQIANALPNSVKTQNAVSESANNHQSITSAQVTTSTPPLTSSGQEITTEVDNRAISSTHLSRSGQKSDSGISVQQIHTDEDPITNNSPEDQSYRNTPGERDTAENIVLGQDPSRQPFVTETPDSEVSAGKVSVQTYPSGANADCLQSSSSDTSNVTAIHVHVENPHPNTVITDGNTLLKVKGEAVNHEHLGSKGPKVKDSVTEISADSDTINDNISNGGRGDTKVSDVNGSGDELRSAEDSCSEPTCSTEKGNILTDDKSDIFRRIFDAISNKNHIIQASAPMGIVMLLGLLFKVNQNLFALKKLFIFF
ncbi:hypothetical protein PVMG_05083 [Plasmodium vivax Mauritania I]|uniref:Variable surface protein Vir18 n=1 Tax=Plasmodium vivax Mauritania I TaxID=1035515 RepID=A0A0J9THP6_PLAVI|nr:hypothetical protein PVMG_05083 [Plasmodium vivax Mauritania I]